MAAAPCIIDWSLCMLCQQSNKQQLREPANGRNQNQASGYSTLVNNLLEMEQLEELPDEINISHLDDGSGLRNTLEKNNAKWHKVCYDKYNSTKVLSPYVCH